MINVLSAAENALNTHEVGHTVSLTLHANFEYSVNGAPQTESLTLDPPYDLADFEKRVSDIAQRIKTARLAEKGNAAPSVP